MLHNATTTGTSVAEGYIHTISNLTINSVIPNAGNPPAGASTRLIKDGPGTLTLTAVNTYSLGTILNAGTLMIANSSGSSVGLRRHAQRRHVG